MSKVRLGLSAIVLFHTVSAAADINYRSFSASAAIGPPAEAFAAKLQTVTRTALGVAGEVHFAKLPGIPTIPLQFAGDIISAVSAGEMGGGFDAAYISGGDLNKAWGFIFNSGIPFGPTFDEFTGFLYGSNGVGMVQSMLDASHRDVIAVPIVGSSEQLSGYFLEPMDDVGHHHGIGLEGLCQQTWRLRYLPPGEQVLSLACDELVARHKIARKNLSFIESVPGGGSLISAIMDGTIQGLEFATPLDDVSQLFNTPNNPGTLGLRYVHTPGWQQQFLLTWMVINKAVWNSMSDSQRILIQTVARDHVISSYGDNMRQQGAALQFILDVNRGDAAMVLSRWPSADQRRLRDATVKFLHARLSDTTFSMADRADYGRVLDAFRTYVQTNNRYWEHREISPSLLDGF